MSAWYRHCSLCGGPTEQGPHAFACWWSRWLYAAERANDAPLEFAPDRSVLLDARGTDPKSVDALVNSGTWFRVKAGFSVVAYDIKRPYSEGAPLHRALELGELVQTPFGAAKVVKISPDGKKAEAHGARSIQYLEFGADTDMEWTLEMVCAFPPPEEA